MTVYVEYVLADNFILDYLLLKLTVKTAGKQICRVKIAAAAALGAIFALFYPLTGLTGALLVLLKTAFGAFMVLISANFCGYKDFLRTAGLFVSLTFVVGGTITGIYSIFGLTETSDALIAFTVLPFWGICFLSQRAYKKLTKAARIKKFMRETEIKAFGITVKTTGFMDTGNGVYDEGVPVIFIDRKTASKFLSNGAIFKMKKIPVITVNGKSEKFAFKSDEITIRLGEEEYKYKDITVCIAGGSFERGAGAILHPALEGSLNDKNAVVKTEKVS